MKTVIGIDLGTQSIKVIFYNPELKKIEASASSSLDLIQDQTGKAEQKAEWWLSALQQCFDAIPQSIKNSATAIGVSGQQHGFVALDAQGEVIAPVKLWCDTTTSEECDEIMQNYGGYEKCISELGNPIVTGYTAPKILWLKKYHPQGYKQLNTILLPHDYLNFHFTGNACMEFGDASGTGLLNIRERDWDSKIIQAIDSDRDLLSCLPKLAEASLDATAGELKPNIAELYGLPEGIPVSLGGGDNMMGAIGTGNVGKGIVTISLGSSGTVYAHSQKPIIDSDARLAAFCSSTNGWLPLLCTMNCTLATELTREFLETDLVKMEELISSAPIGSNGVLSLPFFNGERTPNLPNGKGCLLGLDATNYTKANLLRSAMEGVTFGLRNGIESLVENGIDAQEIRITGGGTKSQSWRQMLADICNLRVVPLDHDEGAAFGAALQAFCMLQNRNHTVSIEQVTREHVTLNQSQVAEPIDKNVQLYKKTYSKYKQAVESISGIFSN